MKIILIPTLKCFYTGLTITAFFIGTIPGPIVFKMVGETSCTFRDSGQCEGTGSCWIYDRIKMAYLFLGICK